MEPHHDDELGFHSRRVQREHVERVGAEPASEKSEGADDRRRDWRFPVRSRIYSAEDLRFQQDDEECDCEVRCLRITSLMMNAQERSPR